MVNLRRPSFTRSKTCPPLNVDAELHKLASTTQIEEAPSRDDFPSPTSLVLDDHISPRGRTDFGGYFPYHSSQHRPSLSSRDNFSQSKSVPPVEISPPITDSRRKSSTYHRMLSYIKLFHLMKKKEEESSLESTVGVDRMEECYVRFPSEISRDISEMEYLRRTQMETLEILEIGKKAVAT